MEGEGDARQERDEDLGGFRGEKLRRGGEKYKDVVCIGIFSFLRAISDSSL